MKYVAVVQYSAILDRPKFSGNDVQVTENRVVSFEVLHNPKKTLKDEVHAMFERILLTRGEKSLEIGTIHLHGPYGAYL